MYEDDSIDGFSVKQMRRRQHVVKANQKRHQKAVMQLFKTEKQIQQQARKLGIPSPPSVVQHCAPGVLPARQPGRQAIKQSPYAAGKKGFMQWMKDEHPGIYNRLEERQPVLIYGKAGQPGIQRRRVRPNLDYEGYNYDTGNYLLHGLGAEAAPAKKEKTWADRIMDFASPLMQAYQQKQIFKAQLERAKQNLPPLKTDEMAVPVKVKVEAGKGLTDTLSKMAMPIGLGVAALFLLPKIIGR